MQPRPGFEDHIITVMRDESREYPVYVTDNGDLIVNEDQGETGHIGDSIPYCDECGRLWPDELADHGISPDWSEA